jgi:2-keto-4-pentenoate hydratase/2-oxohepta-3-ene-1,7-dioic acid hydratase in catechol pathway
VRDCQLHTTQWTPGKNFPGTGSFGPWMVTPDEFGSFARKRIRSRLNGEVRPDAALDDMIFKIAELIEYASTFSARLRRRARDRHAGRRGFDARPTELHAAR